MSPATPRVIPLSTTPPVDPLIFLDIDGVLNSTRFRAEHTGGDGAVTVDGAFFCAGDAPRRATELAGLGVSEAAIWRR